MENPNLSRQSLEAAYVYLDLLRNGLKNFDDSKMTANALAIALDSMGEVYKNEYNEEIFTALNRSSN